MDAHKWFKEAKYGMMVHWGLYSLLGGEYKGEKVSSYAEWAQTYFRIPNAEYEKLATAFNPVYFNADEWVRFAKECGMKYIVVTSKHHEGFAMFKSRADKFNIVDATPFGRDVMAELAEACYKQDMKLGLYYSQDLDWHEKNGGGYLSNHIPNAGTTWDNSWDFPDEAHKDFTECFENKIMPQVEEILTGYGDLCLIWFDVPMTINEIQSRRIYEAVKKYQPNCLINSRLGNGAYDYVSLGDNEIPDKLEDTTGKAVDMNSIGGFKPSPYGLYETAATLNDTWGFSYHDHNWKTPEFIRSTREKLNGMGINYLINVGPDPLGRITADAQRILRGAAK
ncbi:MAG: alpha-L-fucosidase [Candidatus Fimadaptatus sp.]|nr:alpha-L-fucosidase [Candidatus Fimadaptatus sp.]